MNFSAMLTNHPFWGVLMLAVLAWYSTITIYVAIRGFVDIKRMLSKLKESNTETDGRPSGRRP